MKIIVDEIPNTASECLFAEYGESGIMHCRLKGYVCCQLESNSKCENLLPLNNTKIIINNAIKYARWKGRWQIMNRVLTVTFDKSSNGDMPVMIIAAESFGILGNRVEVLNTITGERAVELYNELAKPKKAGGIRC